MKRLLSLIILLVLIACAPSAEHDEVMKINSASLSAESLSAYETTVHPLLVQNCGECHGVNQQPLHSLANSQDSMTNVVQFGLVNFSNPSASRLVAKIQAGHEGISAAVGDSLLAEITAWVAIVNAGGGPGVEPIPLEPTFQSIHKLILIPKCAGCHSPGGERPSEDYSTYDSTMSTGKISGDFWNEIQSDAMPEAPNPALSDEEKTVIRAWLDAGAPNN